MLRNSFEWLFPMDWLSFPQLTAECGGIFQSPCHPMPDFILGFVICMIGSQLALQFGSTPCNSYTINKRRPRLKYNHP